MGDTSAEKKVMRDAARERRGVAFDAAGGRTPAKVIMNVIDAVPISKETLFISAYLPLPGEMDPRPVLSRIKLEGHKGCLPVVAAKDAPLIFRAWEAGDDLEDGPFRTRHPLPHKPEVIPDVLLVPLLAFDRKGHRLGWGGGFYDRTIGGYRAVGRNPVAIGLAFAAQEVAAVPHDEYDQALDWVVTEEAAILTGGFRPEDPEKRTPCEF